MTFVTFCTEYLHHWDDHELSLRRKLPGSFFSVFYMHKVAQFFFSFRSVFNQFSADGPELENRQKTVSFSPVFQNAMSSFLPVLTCPVFYKFSSIATSSRQPSKQEHAKHVAAAAASPQHHPKSRVENRQKTYKKLVENCEQLCFHSMGHDHF